MQSLQHLNLYLEFGLLPPPHLCDSSLSLTDEDRALEDAQKITDAQNSLIAGTLISVKDNFFVQHTRTSAASRVLETLIAPYDATVVKSLKEKSAIIFGKVRRRPPNSSCSSPPADEHG
jgi:Asp-tRNA(Asn)/Glu-tRNA(Gln) amidotransferase A subunit family amidase